MGLFDELTYKGHQYQTKDTPDQLLDQYEIRDDGTLWHQEYDERWEENSESPLGGYIRHDNERWVFCYDFDGLIRFYRVEKEGDESDTKWIEHEALFMNGKMIKFDGNIL
jgi:hypothetical protein